MDTSENDGIYLRLQRELMEAYVASICDHGRIERLTDALAVAGRKVRRETTVDEQSSDSTMPGVLR